MMLDCVAVPPFVGNGVATPVSMADVVGLGVLEPLLFWVARTEASLREASATICFMFLLRRWEGFQWGLRKGLGFGARSRLSRSF